MSSLFSWLFSSNTASPTTAYAQYMHNTGSLENTAVNTNVPAGTPFTIDVPLIESSPDIIHVISGAGGSLFNLKKAGIYVVDYETSLSSNGAIALYKGTTPNNLVMDTNTVVGSGIGSTWIHGRALVQVTDHALVVGVSPATGTATVAAINGASNNFMIRCTIRYFATSTNTAYAEYQHTTNIGLTSMFPSGQNVNVSVGQSFTIDVPVFESSSDTIHAITGNSGTLFNLKKTGTYMIDYETSLTTANTIGLYIGTSPNSLTLDTNTVAASSHSTTWIHGRANVQVTNQALVVAVCPVSATATVAPAGIAPVLMSDKVNTVANESIIRCTIVKTA